MNLTNKRASTLSLLVLIGQSMAGCTQQHGGSGPDNAATQAAVSDPQNPTQGCALLDDRDARREMSAAFERLLLERCGRLSELKSVPLDRPSSRLADGAGEAVTTNTPVNNPAADTSGSRTQSETSIAINENTSTICSAYNDSFSGVTLGTGFSGFSSSTDGGASFVDHGPVPAGAGGASRGDPSLVWRRSDGKFYFTSILSGGLGLWVSNDDCQTFTFVTTLHSGSSDDKELMAVDNNPSSPHFGRLYVAWSDFAQTRRVRSVFSDNGTVWSAPVPLSLGSNVQGAWPTVLPDGTVNIAWSFFVGDTVDIEVVSSTDGGATFAPIVKAVQGVIRPSNNSATSTCGRPALVGPIRFSPFPQLAGGLDGCRHLVYTAAPNANHVGDVADVFYKRTCDATWPSAGTQLNDDATPTDQFMPTLSVGTNNAVSVGWYDRRNDPGNVSFDFYNRISTDGGLTFAPSERISTVSSPVVNDPSLAVCYHGDYDQQTQVGGTLYLQWSDDRSVQGAPNDANIYLATLAVETNPDPPPTVETPAAASPSPVTGTTTNLSVLGADDDGESGLKYTWSTTGTPPAPVTFSVNGSNAAKNTTATFTKAGAYDFQVVIKEANNQSVTSQVSVTVDPTLTSIVIAPATATVPAGATQQFTAVARDQFGAPLTAQPIIAWSVSGGGTIDSTGLFSAAASPGGPFTVTALSGSTSGTATVTVDVPVDPPPTVETPASASPSPVPGTTTNLSVLGADDDGESDLVYTWSTTGSPPAPVSFSANGTNASKNSIATFTAAGVYAFQVVIKESNGQTVSSEVSVTVTQTLSSIAVSPASATVSTGGTQQFAAVARDQFGAVMAAAPTFTWSVSGGGTIGATGLFTAGATAGGPFTVTAQSGSQSGTASVTVLASSTTQTLTPVADAYVRNGTNAALNFGKETSLYVKLQTNATVNDRISFLRFDLAGVSGQISGAKLRLNGSHTSTTSGNPTDSAFAVASNTWSETGITWNNRPPLGAKQGGSVTITPTVKYYEWDVSSFVKQQQGAGISLVSLAVAMDATNGNPDIFNSREATGNRPELVLTVNPLNDDPPTVATPAAASPSPVTGTTTALSVLGADDDGESGLVYTWSTTGMPAAPVTFSANGTNAAKNTVATFTKAGTYAFAVVIREGNGLTASSAVTVAVTQTLTSIVVSPATASVPAGGTVQFIATTRDQFGAAVAPTPVITWSVAGGGSINPNSGLFTAGAMPGGPFTVTAASGGVVGTASVTVGATAPVTLSPTADAYVRDGTSAAVNFGTATTLDQKNSSVAGNIRRTFLRFSLSGVGSTVTQAKLRLHGASVTSAKLVGVYAISNTTWGETTITYNNAPAIGAKQGSSQSVGLTAAYVEWDLTSYVQAQKTAGATAVSFEVKQDVANNETPTTFNSRENASNKPQLVVTP